MASSLICAVAVSSQVAGQNRQSFDESLVARWEFSAEETTKLRAVGGVRQAVAGPRPPLFSDFSTDNTAIELEGNGARMEFDDPGPNSEFDFNNGDEITLEAWVQVNKIAAGANVYIVGKGRTNNAGFPRDNQNWALRLREQKSRCAVSFVFATPHSDSTTSPWHRWTSEDGFKPGKSWHHVAISYRFGQPDSIRCWIDGQSRAGKWDMGGATAQAPVVDDDQIWIGSSQAGNSGNSLAGLVDSVAIYRQVADHSRMSKAYPESLAEHVPKPAPESMPDLQIAPDKVQLILYPGMPAHTHWLMDDESFPREALRQEIDNFLIDRLPVNYDDWGIREAWATPVLIRLAGDISLAAGKQRLLMRVRGLSRLWIDGQVVARGQPIKGSPNGEEPLTPVAKAPAEDARIAEHLQQEVFAEVEFSDAGVHRVVLETIVGGKGHRPDPGETCVAVWDQSAAQWRILATTESQAVALTDRSVQQQLQSTELQMQALESKRRRRLSSSQDDYWQQRHADAQVFVATDHTVIRDAALAVGQNPIDYLLGQRRDRLLATSAQATTPDNMHFHQAVLPILRRACFRCHDQRRQGGLQLDDQHHYLTAADSGVPVIEPGNPAESELVRRITSDDEADRMPPGGAGLSDEQVQVIKQWIADGAHWPDFAVAEADVQPRPVIDDAAFLRRLALDTIGVNPTASQTAGFLNDTRPEKRTEIVEQLLADDRWADQWMGYWQDVLAENPTLINSSLNTTGPFRWFLYEALLDNKPIDRWVSELILMRGDPHEGGSAGFGIAGDNDAPSAAKGQVLASAFLGMEMQCARCHDAPFHNWTQRDLYSLAAMLDKKPLRIPKTSRVPDQFFASLGRRPLIQATVAVDETISPSWPFDSVPGVPTTSECLQWVKNKSDSRELLAACITAPSNRRFAEVVVNRIWKRLIGTGLIEPVDDCDGAQVSDSAVLSWLSDELLAANYDVKRIARWIFTSQLYQRQSVGQNTQLAAELRFLTGPDTRRLSAEQILDSLVAISGRPMDVEELTFDPDGRRAASNRLTLGVPRRAWMLANLANERDRPSLSLPKAQLLVDVLSAFGWNGARQSPRTNRESDVNILQPGVMSSSPAVLHLTRAANESELSAIAVQAQSPAELVESLFLRILARRPTVAESELYTPVLASGFETRLLESAKVAAPSPPRTLPRVTWSNHLNAEINEVALQQIEIARQGPPADPILVDNWRENYEDVVWTIVNGSEFVWYPDSL